MMSLLRPRAIHSILCPRWAKLYSSVDSDIRAHILAELKNAMKSKDTVTSSTLRASLSEIYNADKAAKDGKISSSAIAVILKKGIQRRFEAATQFTNASRQDLADKEMKECEILSKFLPPQLSEEEITQKLTVIVKNLPSGLRPAAMQGLALKEFYSQVDKSLVDTNIVTGQLAALLQSS